MFDLLRFCYPGIRFSLNYKWGCGRTCRGLETSSREISGEMPLLIGAEGPLPGGDKKRKIFLHGQEIVL